jgi:hypothetical protein
MRFIFFQKIKSHSIKTSNSVSETACLFSISKSSR